MPAQILRGSLLTLWPLLKAWLAKQTGVPADRVLLRRKSRRRPAAPHHTADRDLEVHLGGSSVDQPLVHGGGRANTALCRRVVVTCRSRCELGDIDQEEAQLTHATLGHYVLEELVIDALQLWFAEDAQVNEYLQHPLHVLSVGDAEEDPLDEDWTASDVTAEMTYLSNLDQARQ